MTTIAWVFMSISFILILGAIVLSLKKILKNDK